MRHVLEDLVQPAKQVACFFVTHGHQLVDDDGPSRTEVNLTRAGRTSWRENHTVHGNGLLVCWCCLFMTLLRLLQTTDVRPEIFLLRPDPSFMAPRDVDEDDILAVRGAEPHIS